MCWCVKVLICWPADECVHVGVLRYWCVDVNWITKRHKNVDFTRHEFHRAMQDTTRVTLKQRKYKNEWYLNTLTPTHPHHTPPAYRPPTWISTKSELRVPVLDSAANIRGLRIAFFANYQELFVVKSSICWAIYWTYSEILLLQQTCGIGRQVNRV